MKAVKSLENLSCGQRGLISCFHLQGGKMSEEGNFRAAGVQISNEIPLAVKAIAHQNEWTGRGGEFHDSFALGNLLSTNTSGFL